MRFGEHFTTTAFVVVADPVGAGFVDCGAEREMVGAAQAVSPGVTRTAVFEVIEAIQSTFMLRMLRSGPDRALRGREATAPIPDSTRSEGFGTARTSAGIQGIGDQLDASTRCPSLTATDALRCNDHCS